MELGMIGLGRMGANMTERLIHGGHRVVVYDIDSAAVRRTAELGAVAAASIESLTRELKPPRIVWLMVPAGNIVEQTLKALMPFLVTRDIVIDGGTPTIKIRCAAPHFARKRESTSSIPERAAAFGDCVKAIA